MKGRVNSAKERMANDPRLGNCSASEQLSLAAFQALGLGGIGIQATDIRLRQPHPLQVVAHLDTPGVAKLGGPRVWSVR